MGQDLNGEAAVGQSHGRTERLSASPAVLWGLLCLAALGPRAASAVNWDYVPQIGIGASYDSNILYTSPQDARSVVGTFVDGQVDLRADTELNRLSLTPHVRSSWFPGSGNSDLNATDLYLSGSDVYSGMRNQLSLTGELDHVSTRTANYPKPGETTPLGGVPNVNQFRTLYQFTPDWSYRWDSKTTFDWTATYLDVTYSKSAALTNVGDRFDYRNVESSVSLSRTLTPKSLVRISGTGAFFRTAETFGGLAIENDTVQSGASGTFQYSLSDTMETGATAGWNHSTARVGSPIDLGTGLPCLDPGSFPALVPVRCHTESAQNNATGQLYLRKRGERTTANVTLSQSVAPSSQGYTVKQLQLNGTVSREVTTRLSVSAGVNGIRQDSLAKVSTRRTDYGTAQIGLTWRIWEQWSVSGSYEFFFTQESGQQAIAGQTPLTFGGITRNHEILLQLQWRGLANHP